MPLGPPPALLEDGRQHLQELRRANFSRDALETLRHLFSSGLSAEQVFGIVSGQDHTDPSPLAAVRNPTPNPPQRHSCQGSSQRQERLKRLTPIISSLPHSFRDLPARVVEEPLKAGGDWILECDGFYARDPAKKVAKKLAKLARSKAVVLNGGRAAGVSPEDPVTLGMLPAESNSLISNPRSCRYTYIPGFLIPP